MPDLDKLTERRKADRVEIARLMVETVTANGGTAEIETMGPRELWINIKGPRGLRVTIDLDGESVQPDIHVISWNFEHDCDTCFADAFGDINRYHFRKSTDLAYGTTHLLHVLAKRLRMAVDGSAFDPDREAAHVAENGPWQERKARFDAWWKESAEART